MPFVARDPVMIFHCLKRRCRRSIDARTTHMQASMVGAGRVICYIGIDPA
jgi:hypothetical protein